MSMIDKYDWPSPTNAFTYCIVHDIEGDPRQKSALLSLMRDFIQENKSKEDFTHMLIEHYEQRLGHGTESSLVATFLKEGFEQVQWTRITTPYWESLYKELFPHKGY